MLRRGSQLKPIARRRRELAARAPLSSQNESGGLSEARGEARGARREVLNQARRKVERALAMEGAADELAAAAGALLREAEGSTEGQELRALRAALASFHRLRGD